MTDRTSDSTQVADLAGVQLRYRRRGMGRTLLLLHPLRMQLEYFDRLCHELADGPFDLVAVDLPGHGHSSTPRVDYTAAYFTDTIEAFLDHLDLRGVLVVGESIGASIALGLAGRQAERVVGVVAINPYDYGRWGGIRRSSTIGDIVFSTILLPGIGPVVAHASTKSVLRRVLSGGFYDASQLSDKLVDELQRSGRRPGHGRALRSLSRHWKSWISARDGYPDIQVAVTLVYGDRDWSNQQERDANRQAIPGVRAASIEQCGHFSCLEKPAQVAVMVRQAHAPEHPDQGHRGLTPPATRRSQSL
jgi:pimeloyl-ACP methyl ester carboxylesterase